LQLGHIGIELFFTWNFYSLFEARRIRKAHALR